MVQHAGGVDDVERAAAQAWPLQIGLDELDAIEVKAPRRGGAEPERGARQVGADDQPIAARKIEAHLAGSTSDLGDARIPGDRAIEQRGEPAPVCALAQGEQAVACGIAGERRAIVKRSDALAAAVAAQVQVGDVVRCCERRAAAEARPLRRQAAAARRTGQQAAE